MIELDNLLDRIRLIMNSYGLTNSQLCQKIGVQRSLLSHVFSKRNRPSLDFLLKIHEAFDDVTLDWLLLGKGEINLPHDLFSVEDPVVNENSNEDNQHVKDKMTSPTPTTYPSKLLTENADQRDLDLLDKPIEVVFLYPDGTFKIFQNRKQ